MVKISFDSKLIAQLDKIKRKDSRLFELIQLKINLFSENPNHVTLRRHKLKGELDSYWSISINRSLRMVCMVIKDEFYFFDLGTYDQVYRNK
ncbi:MAG: type II toxin-antitoxin system mRNA interferase toxin, RelE/StbE family [Candidatus Shapirobacteria bacterium]